MFAVVYFTIFESHSHRVRFQHSRRIPGMVWLFHCLYLLLKLHYTSLVFCSFFMGDTASSHGTQDFPIKFEENELRGRLSPEQYGVTQNRGTERAFTGIYWDNDKEGTYRCVVCDQQLFSSSTKFNSGSGWPSFYEVLKQGAVKEIVDTSLGMKRTEIVCSKCGAHLGHLFDDGPQPTGKRYCMNSASLHFQDKESATSKTCKTSTGTSKQDL